MSHHHELHAIISGLLPLASQQAIDEAVQRLLKAVPLDDDCLMPSLRCEPRKPKGRPSVK